MMNKCGLTVASRSDSGVISSSVSESALSASDTAASASANHIKLVIQIELKEFGIRKICLLLLFVVRCKFDFKGNSLTILPIFFYFVDLNIKKN